MEKRATVSTSSTRPVPAGRPAKPGPKKPKDARSRILGLALGAGALASLLAYFWLQSLSDPRKANRAAAASVPVLTVVRDIPARTMITKDMVQVVSIPADQAKVGAIRDENEVIGKVTTVSIAKGHPVTLLAIAPPDINMGMAFTLPPNYRAVSVALDPVSAVAGFIKPGDRVDVLATFKGDSGSQSVTCVVLQNIPLLATGSKALPGYTGPPKTVEGTNIPTTTDGGPGTNDGASAKPEEVPTATLMVNPEEAQALVLAASSGKIQLTLRSPNDKEQPTLAGLTSAFFTHGKGKGAALAAQSGASKPVAKPADGKTAVKETPKPRAVAFKASSRKEKVKPAPASRPTLAIKLDGVMLGSDGFAMVTSGPKVWYKKIGEKIAHYRIRNLTEEGMWVRTAQGREELWNVGDSRTVPQ